MHTKASLRRCLLARRAALTPPEVAQKSAVIAQRVCTMSMFQTSRTLMLYLALPHEVQTAPIIAQARQQGKRLVVPVIRERQLVAVVLPPHPEQLRRGPYGILEPRDVQPVVSPLEIDGVYVPGVAFDRHGGRLGFGKGYYDRFLAQLPALVPTCGLAFHCQLVSCIPTEPSDVLVHYVVTEEEVIVCNRRPQRGRCRAAQET